MQNNWETYELGDFAKNVSRRFDFRTYKEVVFVNTSDVLEGKFLTSKLQTSGNLPGQAKKAICKGDLLFSEIRPNNKRFAKVDFDASNYVVSTKFMVIVTDDKIVDKEFFYHVIKSYERLEELQSIAESRSGTFPQITFEAISNVQFSLPPLNEQRAIASILSALDDKIELNLQMNKTLEEMAMALYKHWFIDFGPFKDGKFVESELGMIPEGWEVKSIGEIIETIGGGTPKTSEPTYWQDGYIDWYSPTDLTTSNSLFTLGSAKKITSRGLAKSSAKLLPPYTLLMSSRATIGALTITRKEACTNQGFISMVPNEKISVCQLYCWVKANMELIESKANGSTFREISKTEFRALPILVGIQIGEYIEKSVKLFARIENNLLENQILKQQRETLLPKLISGEIKLKWST